MPPRMRTRSVGRPPAESLGGGTGVRVGRGGRGRRPREGKDERVDDLSGQINDQGMGANEGIEGVNGNENVRNVLVNGNRVGCSYKEFLVCNPKEYDGKGGVVVLTRWIKKMENLQDMSGCNIDQKVKYTAGSFVEFCPSHEMQKLETELWNHTMVEVGHAAYNDRFHELESNGAKDYAKGCADFCKDNNGRDDNKRTRIGNVFATTVYPVGRENAGAWPKCTTCNSYQAPEGPCRTCFNCNRPSHVAKYCRGFLRNMNPVNTRNPPGRACYECGSTDHVRPACPRLNRAQRLRENHPNQVVANNGGQGRGNQENQAREPSELGFIYETEIASGQLVEIDKIIKGCRLEIEGHVFDIDLIPFEHGSHDVIIDGKVLRVVAERSKQKARLLMSVKTSDKYQQDFIVVRDFPEDNSRNSKTKVLFDQVRRLGERQYCSLRKMMFFSKIDLRSG
nr:reverse transcriptase domain-containing protein [Tanacetum cinerariifolium]